jgi:hypothetical protein
MKFSVDLETLYHETGNPLFAMTALANYELCPGSAPLPTWIMDCLREIGQTLEFLADSGQPSVALKKVNTALRLTKQGGNGNAFAEYRRIVRADTAAHIDSCRRELFVHRSGKPENADVSRKWLGKIYGGVSTRTVGDWIKRIRELRAAAQERKSNTTV